MPPPSVSLHRSRFLFLGLSASRRQLSGRLASATSFPLVYIDDNLLYHLVAPEARISFRFAGLRPEGLSTFFSLSLSLLPLRLVLGFFCIDASTTMPPRSIFLLLVQFSIYLRHRRQKYPRNARDDAPLKIKKRVPLLVVSISSVIDSANRLSSSAASSFSSSAAALLPLFFLFTLLRPIGLSFSPRSPSPLCSSPCAREKVEEYGGKGKKIRVVCDNVNVCNEALSVQLKRTLSADCGGSTDPC